MTVTPDTTAESAPEPAAVRNEVWHGLTADEVSAQLGVDPASGLDAAEVARRLAQYGPNKLAEAEKEPGWHSFLRQYRDLMQYVLLGAAIVSIVALQEFSTGSRSWPDGAQRRPRPEPEGKAAESVAALQKMLLIRRTSARGAVRTSRPRSSFRGTSPLSTRATRFPRTGGC
jgi:Ca2+-transporting ATPase